jgi:hypothetical protein
MQPLGKHVLGIQHEKKSDSPHHAALKTLEKFQESAWKSVAYAVLSVAAGIALSDEIFWLKTELLWTECSQLPCEYQTPPRMRFAYACDMAYYTYAIPYCILVETKRKDFWMTFMHHIITVILIGYSYALGFTKVGVVIMFLHDVCDPLLELAKLTKYAKFESLTNSFFVLFMLTWIVMRIVYYPLWVIRSVLFECYDAVLGKPDVTEFPHWQLFSGMLITLWVLHLIWTYTIVKIAVSALTKGAANDPREDGEEDE